MPLKRVWMLVLLCAGLSGLVRAEESELEKARRSANRALDQVEVGVKGAARETQKGGDSVLQKVDDAVHRWWNSLNSKEAKSAKGPKS